MKDTFTYAYSIVVPTHNSNKLIGNLLDSIPDRKNIEVIIVDDYSDDYDGLKKLINSYQNKVKIAITLVKNLGVPSAGSARNAGISLASGKWLILADSDDTLLEDTTLTMDKYADSNADIILFRPRSQKINSMLPSDRTKYLDLCFNGYAEGKISKQELSYRITPIWSKIYRLDKIHDLQFRQTKVANDVGWSAYAAFRTRKNIIVDTSANIYLVNERQGSITRTRRYSVKKVLRRVYERIRADTWLKLNILINDKRSINLGRNKSILRKFLK